LLYNLTGNKGHLSTVAIGQSKMYPNCEISARIMAMYQIIQKVSTEIAIFIFFKLTIFNKGAYLTFKSIFHKALNLF